MDNVQIRPSVIDDLPSLTDMYNHYILHTAITFDGIYREAGRKFGKYWDIEQFEKAIN